MVSWSELGSYLFELFLEFDWGVVSLDYFCVAVPELDSAIGSEFDETAGVVILVLCYPA